MPNAPVDPNASPPVEVRHRVESGASLPLLVWRLDPPRRVLSSAPVGGGLGPRSWIVNAQVVSGYARTDLEVHAHELAAVAALGPDDADRRGVTLFTAADVGSWHSVVDGGVRADATVGVRVPVWAAAPAEPGLDAGPGAGAGTINIVAFLPVAFDDAALVNTVATVTEAKTQALLECGVDGSGTATDAVCLVNPPTLGADPVRFGGPRSEWGSRLARAVHGAVLAGTRSSLARMDGVVITLVLGGARSGKSALAERLVLRHPGPLAYLATATCDPADPDLARRIQAHRDRRDPRFVTTEAGTDLAAALDRAGDLPVLIDALGPWLAGLADFGAAAVTAGADLVAALGRRRTPTVVVSDEVGLGVHPETEVGRHFRDALGSVNQQVAGVADPVLLVVAGRVLRLDRPEDLDRDGGLDLGLDPHEDRGRRP